MSALPGLKDLQTRKRALLLESELNRQVLRLEFQQIGLKIGQLRYDVAAGPWKLGFALVGLVLALKMKRMRKVVRSSFGLFLLRRLWEILSKSRILEPSSGS